jgi:uncharacterized membrane protein
MFLSALLQTPYNRHMPITLLAVNYWLHLVSTVMWLGGLATLVVVTWPGLDRLLGQEAYAVLFTLERRFRPLASISVIVLLVTGMIQMGGDPHYEGFLKLGSLWSISLLLKHAVIFGILIVTAVLQWAVLPALGRARMLSERQIAGGNTEEIRLWQRYRRLAVANLALGLLALLFTAVLTAV